MHRILAALDTTLEAAKRAPAPPAPALLGRQVAAVLLFVAAYIALAYWLGTKRHVDYYFEEGRAIDVLSALFLVMAGSFAWVCFLLRRHDGDRGRWFWLLLAVGFLFVALDEMLEFHETFDEWLRDTWVGWPPLFRNWNDVIVIGYGVAGLALLMRFRSEMLRLPRATALLGFGALFYGLHTGIDALVSGGPLKTVIEESAKLTATAFFALAMLAAVMALLAALRGGRAIAPERGRRSIQADPIAAG